MSTTPPTTEAPSLTPSTTPSPPTTPATPTTPPASPTAATPTKDTPAWAATVPEKYRRDTAEATLAEVAKGYTELEKKIGKPAEATPPPAPVAPLKVSALLDKVGVKPDDLTKAWKEKGELTADQYKAFADKGGLDREAVDEFVSGQAARIELAENRKAKIVADGAAAIGGADAVKAVTEWAKTNIPDRVKTLQKAIDADPTFYPEALRLLNAEYGAKTGTGGSKGMMTGTQAPAGGDSGAFTTPTEMHNAMAAARAKYGDWTKDAALIARMTKTPQSIKSALK